MNSNIYEYSLYLYPYNYNWWTLMFLRQDSIKHTKMDKYLVIANVDIPHTNCDDPVFYIVNSLNVGDCDIVTFYTANFYCHTAQKQFNKIYNGDAFTLCSPGFLSGPECRQWWEQKCKKEGRKDIWKDYTCISVVPYKECYDEYANYCF